MITIMRELTLFGGWAKMLTPKEIEIGVSKHLDTVSVSSSEIQLKTQLQMRFYIKDAKKPQETSFVYENDINGELVYRVLGKEEISNLSELNISHFLQDKFKKLAFVRYVEIWGERWGVRQDLLLRAIDGTEKMRLAFSGILGNLNSKNKIRKEKDGWKLIDDINDLYPYTKKLPEAGIKRARQVAYEHKQNG